MTRRDLILGGPLLLGASRMTADAKTGLPLRFVEVTSQVGIDFQHNSGAFGGKYLPETLGPGCAFLDYDNDGWQDIILINGMDWPGHKQRRTTLRLNASRRETQLTLRSNRRASSSRL